jgi:hypothetical protein
MHLQDLVQRARVPLRRQGDGCVALDFPPILPRCSGATILSPVSTSDFSMLFLGHDTGSLAKLLDCQIAKLLYC